MIPAKEVKVVVVVAIKTVINGKQKYCPSRPQNAMKQNCE